MIDILSLILAIIIGMIIGSFTTAMSYRIPRNISLFSRSFCPHCKQTLHPKNLIPVISYIFQKGRCTYCHTLIPRSYFYTEILLVIAVLPFYQILLQDVLYFSLIVCILLICAIIYIIDIHYLIISNSLVFLLFCTIFCITYISNVQLLPQLYTFITVISTLYTIKYLFMYFRKKDGLGTGDIKLIGVISMYILDIEQILLFFIITGLCGVMTHYISQKHRNNYFPFAPSIIISFYFILIYKNLSLITN